MIQIQAFTFNAFAENMYLLFDESKECIVIDPGCHSKEEENILVNFIANNELKIVQLLNTHCHIDHVFGNQFIKDKYQVELKIHSKDLPVLESCATVAQMYGIQGFVPSGADSFFEEGDKVTFGNSELDIIFVPGHAPGHVAFVSHAQKFVIGGDVLFQGSIGRTDLPGGDFNTLISSIKNKFFPLGDDYTVYSGHGPETTIGFERLNNPFLV